MDFLELGGPTCDLKSDLRAMFRCNQRKPNSPTVGVCRTSSKGVRDNLRSTQTNSEFSVTFKSSPPKTKCSEFMINTILQCGGVERQMCLDKGKIIY